MAQAATASTDELLSQLAASEIDRLLAEADGNPAPVAQPAAQAPVGGAPGVKAASAEVSAAEAPAAPTFAPGGAAPVAEGDERAALLQAAGFDSAPPSSHAVAAPEAAASAQPVSEERSALLQAAGFDTPASPPAATRLEDSTPKLEDVDLEPDSSARPPREPIYLKPLIWLNSPLDSAPVIVRQILGKVGIVTLINALAVLTYVFFFRKR